MVGLPDLRSHSKSGPFETKPLFDHSKSRLGPISPMNCPYPWFLPKFFLQVEHAGGNRNVLDDLVESPPHGGRGPGHNENVAHPSARHGSKLKLIEMLSYQI